MKFFWQRKSVPPVPPPPPAKLPFGTMKQCENCLFRTDDPGCFRQGVTLALGKDGVFEPCEFFHKTVSLSEVGVVTLCPHCQKEVTYTKTICIHCGEPMPAVLTVVSFQLALDIRYTKRIHPYQLQQDITDRMNEYCLSLVEKKEE